MDNSLLYNWIFNYNPFIKKWCAVKREDYNQLFSNKDVSLKASDIQVLIELILKTDGDIDKINKLLKNEKTM